MSAEAPAPTVRILGTRGIPGRHGVFESATEDLGPFLVARGWRVIVYCQETGSGPIWQDEWNGIERVHVPVERAGALGTIVFDLLCTRHALKERDLILVFGYNTAVFSLAYRLCRVPSVMNMDGLEWRRGKWSRAARAWLWTNERLGILFSDHLIADHPEIARYLSAHTRSDRITMIPYGARQVDQADAKLLAPFGIEPRGYLLVIARWEPENSVLDIVRAYSAAPRRVPLLVLGRGAPGSAYGARVVAAAGPDVRFPGAIYDRPVVDALRRYALAYVHGHTVGGTNPSLLEALGAGSPVVAHDNPFNRWVAGDAAHYFTDERSLADALERLTQPGAGATLDRLSAAARARHAERFRLEDTNSEYERLLQRWLPRNARGAA